MTTHDFLFMLQPTIKSACMEQQTFKIKTFYFVSYQVSAMTIHSNVERVKGPAKV